MAEREWGARGWSTGAARRLGDSGTWRIWGISFDARLAQLVIASTTLLLLSFGGLGAPLSYSRFFLQFVVPLVIVVAAWREDPRRYGLRLGNWRLGLAVVAVGIAVMAAVILVVARWPEFGSYYRAMAGGRPGPVIAFELGLEILAWEFFCRGWLLNALAARHGTDAIWLQVVPFALMHLVKPQVEALSTVFGGAIFGMVAWRTGSCLYGWLVHWFMMVFIVVVAAGYV